MSCPPCGTSTLAETQLQAEEVGVFTRENTAGHLLCHLHQPRSKCQRTCLNAQNGVGHLHGLPGRLEVEPMFNCKSAFIYKKKVLEWLIVDSCT